MTYKYQNHRKNGKVHFRKRWKERIGSEPPPWDLLQEEFQKVLVGKPSPFLKLQNWSYHTSRWMAKMGDEEVTISYNHQLRMPVTVWLASDRTGSNQKEEETHVA